MQNKIGRRQFIVICSAAAAVSMLPLLPGCSKRSDLELAEFKKLSAVLTGFQVTDMDNDLAAIYYKSILEFPPVDVNPSELFADLELDTVVTPAPNIIEQKIYSNPKKTLLANTIITYWLSGSFKSKDGIKVSDYQLMYAWKATGYLIPNAQCRGDFGFWSNKPHVV